jgi:aspartate carbamoyltransferase catalytic subunit
MTVGFCGDLKYGRTVHSLLSALSRYEGIKVVLISPPELKIPSYIKYEVLDKYNIEYTEVSSLEEALPLLDVLYMTRIQKERFADPFEYERLKDCYVLTQEKMKLAKENAAILHPLPRVNEISVKVDDDPRACYFRQAKYGKYMRMALIMKLLDEAKREPKREKLDLTDTLINRVKCENSRCITGCEQELDQIFKITDRSNGICRCIFCEAKQHFQE